MSLSDAQAALAPLRDAPAESAILLDFDGTLSPIVPRPEDARLAEGAAAAVAALVGRFRLVAFVSGRGLADLEARVAVPGIAYAGNHGMELRAGDGARIVDPQAAPWVETVARFGAGIAPELATEGIHVEDKGVTLSLHTRRAADPDAADRFLAEVIAPRAEEAGLRPTPGRRVLEIRPPARVDKGTATRALVGACGATRAAYVGDDRTDADAWRELAAMRAEGLLTATAAIAAVGPEVGPEVVAAADATVDGPGGAVALLRWLAGG